MPAKPVLGVVIHTDGTRTDLHEISLEVYQDAVGGYVDALTVSSMVTVFMHDSGMFELPQNNVAMLLFSRPMWGDVVMVGGVDAEGNTLPLPTIFHKRIKKLLAKRPKPAKRAK
jgi:hypothetical protein